jgi:hypothetical protein
MQKKEVIRREKEAYKLLWNIHFVGIEEYKVSHNTIFYLLLNKDESYTICFTLGGMTLEGIKDEEFQRHYVNPLKTFATANAEILWKFLDVPIDFTEKINSTKDIFDTLETKDTIRKTLMENDLEFYNLLQEEKLLQTFPVWFVPIKNEDDIKQTIASLDTIKGFHLQFFNKEQLKIIAKYINNPGTMIPAFDIL